MSYLSDEFWEEYYRNGEQDFNQWNFGSLTNSGGSSTTTTTQKGQNWLTVMNAILQGGTNVLNSVTGFIQAKNGKSASISQLDEATAARLLALTGGNITAGTVQAATQLEARNASILGLPASTWVILLGVVLLFLLLRPEFTSNRKQKR